jgi:glycosyltransferase involved in cell wall biosynthesis
MGPFWYDTLPQSPFADWQPKIIRLDMAVDTQQYLRAKMQFNAPGKRGYLYIGSNRPEKGCEVLARTMAGLQDYRCSWVGDGPEIASMRRLHRRVELTPELVAQLARDHDIFVNTSVSDANPTTILEAMAWGFPVACTPQSGYYRMPSLISLSTTDISANIEKLRQLQEAPEATLSRVAETNLKLVRTDYTWHRFCDSVWNVVSEYC